MAKFWRSSPKIGIEFSVFLQQSLKSYWERVGDNWLMLATIRDDTWNGLNMQHIIPNSKRWGYADIPGGGHEYIKTSAHIVEGGHHLRKALNPHPRPTWKRQLCVVFVLYRVYPCKL